MSNLAPITHMLALTNVRRARMLPYAGKVLVRNGQKVIPTDVLAEAHRPSRHLLVDVRRALRVTSGDQVQGLKDLKVGDFIKEGDILAETRGLFRRVIKAPMDGEIVAISSGQVLLELPGEKMELLAGLAGTVMEVIPDKGAIIEGNGALIQGVWGNERINFGLLSVVARNPEDELTRARLDVSLRGAVILGGHCASADALQACGELALRGVILGSMTADLIPVASALETPVILLEGFGRIPINSVAFKILATNQKRDIALNAAPWEPFTGSRPEVFIPLPATGELPPEVDEFKAGQTVRVIASPYAGQIGAVVEVLPGMTQFIKHTKARAALVRLENNEQVSIPLVNLDVLE